FCVSTQTLAVLRSYPAGQSSEVSCNAIARTTAMTKTPGESTTAVQRAQQAARPQSGAQAVAERLAQWHGGHKADSVRWRLNRSRAASSGGESRAQRHMRTGERRPCGR